MGGGLSGLCCAMLCGKMNGKKRIRSRAASCGVVGESGRPWMAMVAQNLVVDQLVNAGHLFSMEGWI